MCSWHTHSRVVCVSCALYHHVRRGTRCTICAVPCALYHVHCTICAIPFAPYHARCIMWCRRADPRGRARSGRSVHGVVHSRSGVKRSLVMCFSHLCFSALYSSHSCGSSFSGRRERGNATGLRPGHVPCQFAIAMCGAGGRGEDAQVRVCRVGITSWRFGSVRRPSRMGAGIGRSASGFGRARARGRVGRGRRERRGAPVYPCTWLRARF